MRVSRVPGVIVVQIYWSFKTIMLNPDVATELFIVLLLMHRVLALDAQSPRCWCKVFPLPVHSVPAVVRSVPASGALCSRPKMRILIPCSHANIKFFV